MKVLFAVSNENISEKILKTYQKEYKEIISYKNVYYFNAILKEIQRDKSYDRIVISEDLEPFANNNYDAIDKFLFEKLDSISDEATDDEGNDTSIILICTDRRTKSDSILVKLFGIGIYNAILGQDRSIEEVCRLIYKPRNKKEAKIYYKIEVDDVNYQTENESDVNEVEIQNILAHYKRLGRDEEKYEDSFNNIASQYTDAQLRVIIKFLPMNVKAVLEENSPKYQQIMIYKDGKNGNNYIKNKTIENKNTARTIKSKPKTVKMQPATDLKIESLEEVSSARLTKPVVIPTEMSKTSKKILNEPKEENNILKNETIQVAPEMDEIPKKQRGRPRKVIEPQNTQEQIEEIKQEEPIKKRRGRPKKTELISNEIETSEEEKIEESKIEEEPINLFELSDENTEEQEQPENYVGNVIQNTQTNEIIRSEEPEPTINYNMNNFISKDNKMVAFVGTSKNGTSFLVNNLADILSNIGINTAILDLTENKNSYYIYTKNDENLRKTANSCIEKLTQGITEGITVKRNLTVYTSVPGENNAYNQAQKIMETLSRNYSLILLDTDYKTPVEYFAIVQEIYLVQSMDILTIQPLTAFLRELKAKNVLDEQKLRIVINKEQKVSRLSPKVLIGGMAFYNEPSMSFMTELFNRDRVKYYTIPFDTQAYVKYLESLVTCEISTNGYSKNILAKLKELANAVYPMLGKQQPYKSKFSPSITSTLNQMKNNY